MRGRRPQPEQQAILLNAKGPQFEEIEYWRQRGRILDQGTDLANEPARICTLLPSSRSTGGLSITWSPCLTPSLISICVSRVVRDQVRDRIDYAFDDLG